MHRRGSGILLHMTSLPSPYGIGDLGPGAYRFADFLAHAKQGYWQVLPLNPVNPGCGHSPYSSTSAFAGNTLLVSPELLHEDGLLSWEEIESRPVFPQDRCDFARVLPYKEALFERAWKRFQATGKDADRHEAFCLENAGWLEDFALFVVLRNRFQGRVWSEWPVEFRDRKPEALQAIRKECHAELEKEKFLQHLFFDRLPAELELVQRHRPPVVITALGSPARVVDAVHAYGGLVFADVGSIAMARKAAQSGVDGLILVCTGAGGHTGSVSPFVFVDAVRQFFDGIVVLAGGICNGGAIRAAEVAGADLADIGTLFIAARESLASDDYRQMVVEAGVDDLVLTRAFTGASAYYLRRSVERYGLDPDNLSGKTAMDWKDSEQQLKAWKDIWSAGQSVSAVSRVEGAASHSSSWVE